MLGDKIGLNICYGDKNVELLLNMQSIKNIYTLTNRNPFKVLQDFIGSIDKEDKDTLLTQVIYSLSNGDITIEDIYGYVLDIEEENKLELLIGIVSLIERELVIEVSEEEDSTKDKKNPSKDKEESQDKDENQEKEIQSFIDWWDYYYYIATVVLNKTEEEFYNLTPRELKTLEALDSRYKRAILIKTYIDINTPRGEESDITTDKVYVDSFSDLF
ncbi:hypothetical protein [Clostridium paraputrificum]|uniref:hypothetical protein n=1 Tax=Clostridium paraputrificum TaxID=29363 RepID=UPI00374F1AF1